MFHELKTIPAGMDEFDDILGRLCYANLAV
jgi:hypothetical protein